MFYSQRIIDYLKLDIEGWEWDALLTMIRENVLHRVKQLGVEIHTRELFGTHRGTSTRDDYAKYLRVFTELESLGFRKWYSHYNTAGIYRSPRTKNYITCCVELVYINMNFMKPHYLYVSPECTPHTIINGTLL